jgi:hypothetical protein
MSRQRQELTSLNQYSASPRVSSQSGGQSVNEAKSEPDEYIKFFQDDIKQRNEKIQRVSDYDRHTQVQGTADFYQLAYFQVTFHLDIMNWLDERRINKLRDPNLSEEERESIHQVYHDRQKGIFQYLWDKLKALFSAVIGLFFSSKPTKDEFLSSSVDEEDEEHDDDDVESPVVRRRK